MIRRAITAALVLASCGGKKDEASSGSGSAPPPTPPVTSADEMLKRSFERIGTGYFASSIEIAYVREDGTLDDTYGSITIDTGKHKRPKPPKPPDDPNRPIGAPEPPEENHHEYLDMALAKCPEIRWRNGEMTVQDAGCSMFMNQKLRAPRCTVLGIWASAKAAGAPANALAKITFDVSFGDDPVQSWKLTVDDEPRGIHFRHEGNDDCAPIAEKP